MLCNKSAGGVGRRGLEAGSLQDRGRKRDLVVFRLPHPVSRPKEREREHAAEAAVCARVSVRVCTCLQVAAAAGGTRAGDPSAVTSPRVFQGDCSFGGRIRGPQEISSSPFLLFLRRLQFQVCVWGSFYFYFFLFPLKLLRNSEY